MEREDDDEEEEEDEDDKDDDDEQKKKKKTITKNWHKNVCQPTRSVQKLFPNSHSIYDCLSNINSWNENVDKNTKDKYYFSCHLVYLFIVCVCVRMQWLQKVSHIKCYVVCCAFVCSSCCCCYEYDLKMLLMLFEWFRCVFDLNKNGLFWCLQRTIHMDDSIRQSSNKTNCPKMGLSLSWTQCVNMEIHTYSCMLKQFN